MEAIRSLNALPDPGDHLLKFVQEREPLFNKVKGVEREIEKSKMKPRLKVCIVA